MDCSDVSNVMGRAKGTLSSTVSELAWSDPVIEMLVVSESDC